MLNRMVKLFRYFPLNYGRLSYSQEGEDVLLGRLLENRERGFYIDVGAHHPIRFSNTYYFYQKGWKGINIDAMPGSMRKFDKFRPRDLNLEMAISDEERKLEYFMFEDSALNTFSKSLMEQYVAAGWKLLGVQQINTKPLHAVLREHLSPNSKIDFMSIDIEGEDLNALHSNDWNMFRPEFVLVEILGLTSLEDVYNTDQCRFMVEVGYLPVAKTVNTVFFRDVSECAASSAI